MMAHFEAFLEFSSTNQEPKQSNTDYNDLFKSRFNTVTSHGGQMGYNLKLYDK